MIAKKIPDNVATPLGATLPIQKDWLTQAVCLNQVYICDKCGNSVCGGHRTIVKKKGEVVENTLLCGVCASQLHERIGYTREIKRKPQDTRPDIIGMPDKLRRQATLYREQAEHSDRRANWQEYSELAKLYNKLANARDPEFRTEIRVKKVLCVTRP